MHFTELSGLMAVFWSSLFIVLIYYIRKKENVHQLSEVLCLVLLYLFSGIRMLISIDFIPSIGIDIPGFPSDAYGAICKVERSVGRFSLTISDGLHIIWIVVAVLLLIRYYMKYRQVVHWVRTFRKYDGVDEAREKVWATIGKKIDAEIRRGIGIDSPVGIGIFHKIIVLPDKEYTSEELYYILLHEYTHFRNYDLVVKTLGRVYMCIFWWNPVVYLLKKDLERHLEIKCDLASVKHMTRDEVIEYLQTVIKVINEMDDKPPTPYTGFIALANEDDDELEERFWIISDNQNNQYTAKRTVVYAVVFTMLLILSYSFMPQPYFEPPDQEIETGNSAMEFSPEDSYLYIQKNGEYLLIKDDEFEFPIDEDGFALYKSFGFEVREEK